MATATGTTIRDQITALSNKLRAKDADYKELYEKTRLLLLSVPAKVCNALKLEHGEAENFWEEASNFLDKKISFALKLTALNWALERAENAINKEKALQIILKPLCAGSKTYQEVGSFLNNVSGEATSLLEKAKKVIDQLPADIKKAKRELDPLSRRGGKKRLRDMKRSLKKVVDGISRRLDDEDKKGKGGRK